MLSLYLLVLMDHSKFKIGITNNIPNRINQLEHDWGEFALEVSCKINGDNQVIRKLETVLHFLFEQYQIQGLSNKKAGYTEWFDVSCFEKVKALIVSFTETKKGLTHLEKGIKIIDCKESKDWFDILMEEKKAKKRNPIEIKFTTPKRF